MFGIPYADQISANTVECPVCKKHIRLARKKDAESYSTSEYAKHYQREHAEHDAAGRA